MNERTSLTRASASSGRPDKAQSHRAPVFDVVMLGDFACPGDCGLRVAQEVRTCRGFGYTVGLLHLPGADRTAAILPDIRRCERDGLASVISPETGAKTRLAVVFSPGKLPEAGPGLGRLQADRIVLVLDRMPNPKQMGLWFRFASAPMSWAPTNRWIRAKLDAMSMAVALEPLDWRAIGRPLQQGAARTPGHRKIVVGRVSTQESAQWPKTPREIEEVYGADPAIDFRIMGPPPAELLKKVDARTAWTILDWNDISVERFVDQLDAFVYYPGSAKPELPEAAIATAMASGKVVILPETLRPHFGPGAIYAEPAQALDRLKALMADAAELAQVRETAKAQARLLFGDTWHRERLEELVKPATPRPVSPRGRSKPVRRALMVASNGIGLGHLTRLLAIARRMDKSVEPVFASHAQPVSVIDSFGFEAEYFPSFTAVRSEFQEWDAWLRFELSRMIERYQADALVFDGNNPSPGLVRAALSHGACRLVWVRRAMCPAKPSPHLENARFFDQIIEPGEFATERDVGPTATRRHEALMVPPIRLLDASELLTRKKAREELCLSMAAPAAIVTLGAGANRDVLGLVDRIVRDLGNFPDLQIVIAEWGNALLQLPHWPRTRLLRGFPISRYCNAFDFAIASAGYNTYHENIAFGLPTIFVANRHPSMDDQGGRAEYAQEYGAGFDLAEDQMHLLPALCEALLNTEANRIMRENCARFGNENGADAAAAAIASLVEAP